MYTAQYYVHDYIYYNCNLYTYSKYEQCVITKVIHRK